MIFRFRDPGGEKHVKYPPASVYLTGKNSTAHPGCVAGQLFWKMAFGAMYLDKVEELIFFGKSAATYLQVSSQVVLAYFVSVT